jgi:hypothetical protein
LELSKLIDRQNLIENNPKYSREVEKNIDKMIDITQRLQDLIDEIVFWPSEVKE